MEERSGRCPGQLFFSLNQMTIQMNVSTHLLSLRVLEISFDPKPLGPERQESTSPSLAELSVRLYRTYSFPPFFHHISYQFIPIHDHFISIHVSFSIHFHVFTATAKARLFRGQLSAPAECQGVSPRATPRGRRQPRALSRLLKLQLWNGGGLMSIGRHHVKLRDGTGPL